MNVERLLQAKEFLSTVPEDKFDMTNWRGVFDNLKSIKCETVGCAMGWLTEIIPEKFIIRNKSSIIDEGVIQFQLTGICYFGLTQKEFTFLFGAEWGNGKYHRIEDVQDRIDYLIENTVPYHLFFNRKYKV